MAKKKDPHKRVAGSAQAGINPALHNGRAVIGGCVIDNNQFEALLSLRTNALQRFGNAIGVIEQAHNNPSQRRPLPQIGSLPVTDNFQRRSGAVFCQGYRRLAGMTSPKLRKRGI